jgi:preprotein translocase subunit YajC
MLYASMLIATYPTLLILYLLSCGDFFVMCRLQLRSRKESEERADTVRHGSRLARVSLHASVAYVQTPESLLLSVPVQGDAERMHARLCLWFFFGWFAVRRRLVRMYLSLTAQIAVDGRGLQQQRSTFTQRSTVHSSMSAIGDGGRHEVQC